MSGNHVHVIPNVKFYLSNPVSMSIVDVSYLSLLKWGDGGIQIHRESIIDLF